MDEIEAAAEQHDRQPDPERPGARAAPSGSGLMMSGSAEANATPNHTTGGNSSHEMSANAATPARLPAMFAV